MFTSINRFVITITVSSLVLSVFLLTLLNFIFGEDRAGTLANALHLGNGLIVAALLGGITGLWLALGGVKRAAWLAGSMLGLVVAFSVWSVGQRYTWVIEALLTGLFGKLGATFTPLVTTLILFSALRWATQTSALYLEAALRYLKSLAHRTQTSPAII
jgi:hypothetical protein